MLLLNKVISVNDESATALTTIDEDSLFFVPDKGIPIWVGLEFMGQTAALIAGFQQQQGQLASHTGFLLGSRAYKGNQAWFQPGHSYTIHCQQDALLGESLASFKCTIHDGCIEQATDIPPNSAESVASALLTVYRQSATPGTKPSTMQTTKGGSGDGLGMGTDKENT